MIAIAQRYSLKLQIEKLPAVYEKGSDKHQQTVTRTGQHFHDSTIAEGVKTLVNTN